MIFVLLTSLSANAGTATLSWTPPTTNADGTPLTDLAGYKIYYGTASRTYSQPIDVGNVTTYFMGGFADGKTYYFAVKAYDTARNESGYSIEASKTFPAQTFALTVSKAGSGTIVSSPMGINCGVTCSQSYSSGTVVALTAIPASGSILAGWSGDADCTDGLVTMTAGKTCIAQFTTSSLAPPRMRNISTRALAQTGDQVMIGGFVIKGSVSKTVLVRARGPSMAGAPFLVQGTLTNPLVQLYSFAARAFIAQNDNWQTTDPLCSTSGYSCGSPAQITATGLDPCQPIQGQTTAPPGCVRESAILITLPPGAYGAIVSGVNGGTGVGMVEVFDLDTSTLSKLVNVSTRALVLTGDSVEIGSFIIGVGTGTKTVLIRARGPFMGGDPFNVQGTLPNPFVQLYSFTARAFIAQNDNWQTTDPLCSTSGYTCGTPAQITTTGLDPCRPNPGQSVSPPGCGQESAILIALPPGAYSAIVSGVGGQTGVGLVEVFEIQ